MPDTAPTSTAELLDLLDAITEIRVSNPELRPAVLASLRLMSSIGRISAGRLYSLSHDHSVSAIIAHGQTAITEDEDRSRIALAAQSREVLRQGPVQVFPLGKERRLYGVLILEGAELSVAQFLADLFLQWHAVAEFVTTQRAELIDENYALREEIRMQFEDRNLVGVSGSFRRIVESARRVAASTATVLIHGETGTGKELIARLIHQHSPRANKPFITVNCGALSESLLETELFGHVKGAFTGAIADHKGRFEVAHEGTIFLDEIGEITQAMQVRLLRVLQEMEVVRVGDTRTRKLDVRVIAATNRDLEKEVASGRFRADLWYRLNVVYLSVPPLRQRPEDIPVLLEHFLSAYCQRNYKVIEHVTKEVMEALKAYSWPGNIRELENCVEKMVVMSPGRELTPDLLPMSVVAYARPPTSEAGIAAQSFESMLKRFMQSEAHLCHQSGASDLYERVRAKWERHLFEATLDLAGNNKSMAARLLGITRNTLNARLNELCRITRQWAVE